MRRVVARIRDARDEFDETFAEGERGSFQVGCSDPERWVRDCVARFNATLRPHESAREVVSLVTEQLGDAEARRVEVAHDWHKTNLITVEGSGSVPPHDVMRCSVCGITGKRFGLTTVMRDAAFRAKGYATCSGAARLLARRRG